MLQDPLLSPGVNLNSSYSCTGVLCPTLVINVGIAVWCSSGLYLIDHKGKATGWGGTSLVQRATRQGPALCHVWLLFHREAMLRVPKHLATIRGAKRQKASGSLMTSVNFWFNQPSTTLLLDFLLWLVINSLTFKSLSNSILLLVAKNILAVSIYLHFTNEETKA